MTIAAKRVDDDLEIQKALIKVYGTERGGQVYREYRLYRRENHHLNIVFSTGWVALNSLAEKLAILKYKEQLPAEVLALAVEARRTANQLRHKWHEFNLREGEEYWKLAIESLWSKRMNFTEAEQDLVAEFLAESAKATRKEWVQRIDELLFEIGTDLSVSSLRARRPNSDAPTKSAIHTWINTGVLGERTRDRGDKAPLGARERLKKAVKAVLKPKFGSAHDALVDAMPGRWALLDS